MGHSHRTNTVKIPLDLVIKLCWVLFFIIFLCVSILLFDPASAETDEREEQFWFV